MQETEYGYQQLCEDVLSLRGQYQFLRIGSIGKSLCGRSLYSIELGEGGEAVLYAGAFHGMERITAALLMKFVRCLCAAHAEDRTLCGLPVRSFFASCRLCVVPCVNPDGVELSLHGLCAAGEFASFLRDKVGPGGTAAWQANARGVDLNHNFDAGWHQLRALEIEAGYLRPGPTRFGGYAPASEPETAALVRLCRSRAFPYALAFHSQGEEIYYDYGADTPDTSLSMAQQLARASGYRLAEPEPIASMGGFKDWFIHALHRPAFTIEVGLGKNPLPPRMLAPLYARLEQMLVTGLTLS